VSERFLGTRGFQIITSSQGIF